MKPSINKFALILAGIVFVTLLAGKALLPLVARQFVTVQASYVEYPVETMLTEAPIIFVGQVVEISETRWNQDSGEFWAGGLPYHQVTLAVVQTIAGEVEEKATLTVIGNHPLDDEAAMQSDHSWRVGDEMVVFARQTELTWREPERMSALMLMGSPQSSVLLKGEDGLYHAASGEAYTLADLSE